MTSGKRFGIDTGGTFTDVVMRDAQGILHVHKRLSTPADPSQAIAQGMRALNTSGEPASLVHGTTVATNALLERSGARVALLATAGFEDVLSLGRQQRPELYALHIKKIPPLIPLCDCFGVPERTRFDASIERALTPAALDALGDALAARGPFGAIAICLLHAYANPAHEQRLATYLRARFPEVFVSASHEIVRELREYERASTVSVNAFVGPVMSGYLARLAERVRAEPLEIFESSGTRSALERAARLPVHTVLSGPAGGVMGAMAAARELELPKIIAFDMGGTSTDVSLCDGEPTYSESSQLGGLPLLVPTLDIYTVGAGGGSTAHVDEGGALKVGPRSAGSSPGPASYANGGTLPTVTDAHVVLGRLRPEAFLGGEMTLDRAAALTSFDALAATLKLTREQVALGVLQIADAAMGRAIKVISLERGHDPRDFALVSFGGAGGLHACRLASSLGMRRVVVPRHPGLLSAHGMLHAPQVKHAAQTVMVRASDLSGPDRERLQAAFYELKAQVTAQMPAGCKVRFFAELRYVGQSFTLRCDVDPSAAALPLEEFEARHEALYGWRASGRAVELVTVRARGEAGGVAGEGRSPSPATPPASPRAGVSAKKDAVFFGAHSEPCALLERAQLAEGSLTHGPCIITEYSGTTAVPPGWQVRVRCGHLVLEQS